MLKLVGNLIFKLSDHSSWTPLLSFFQYGVEFVAEHVVPLLTPLLVAQQLNVQQFAKFMHFVKDVLRYFSHLLYIVVFFLLIFC